MPVNVEESAARVEPAPQSLSVAVLGPQDAIRTRLESALADSPVASLRHCEDDDEDAVCLFPCDPAAAGWIEAVQAQAQRRRGPLILIVPGATAPREVKAGLRAGAAGVVREPDAATCLAATVRAVGAGQLAIPIDLARQIEKPVLSRRQKQVLGLVVLGLSNGEIAAKLHLSEHTVKCHLYASFRKLSVNSRDEAVSLILDPDEGLGTGILSISEDEVVRVEAPAPVAG